MVDRLMGMMIVISALTACDLKSLGNGPSEGAPVPTSIKIAHDDIIRIATPFAEPRVVTTSSADIQQNQHVLYVLPDDDARITMFVTDADDEAYVINLTLIPERDGVREIDLVSATATSVRQASASTSAKPAGVTKAKSPKDNLWGKPCRLCRDPDDENDKGYDSGGSGWNK